MPIALLSAYDKGGLEDFARALKKLGWSLLGSAGTAKFLNEKGITTQDVAELVGPPILGHKVVTLSREIHAGLLADNSPEEQAELDRLGIPRIDLAYVNLYPLAEEVGKKTTLASVLEKTDIGGPTMLRAAAKGRRFVLHAKYQMEVVLNYLTKRERQEAVNQVEHERFISSLVSSAELEVSHYCRLSSDYHAVLHQVITPNNQSKKQVT